MKAIAPSSEDSEIVCNKSSKNTQSTYTTLTHAHGHTTHSLQPPSSCYFFDGNNIPYMGINEFFKCVGKDDYEHESYEERRKKLGDVNHQAFFSAAADPYVGKLKVPEAIKLNGMFYKQTSDNNVHVLPRPQLPHHSFELSTENFIHEQDKYMPPLQPTRSGEYITMAELFNSKSATTKQPSSFRSAIVSGVKTMIMKTTTTATTKTAITTTIDDERLNIPLRNKCLHKSFSEAPVLIPCIVVTTPTSDNRAATTTSILPKPFSMSSGSKTNQHDIEKDTSLLQQQGRHAIDKVSCQKDPVKISDEQNKEVVSKRSLSESNAKHAYKNNSNDYENKDVHVDIIGNKEYDDNEDNLPSQPSTEAMNVDGNTSDNSCYSEVYNFTADGSVAGNNPSNNTLRSSTDGSSEKEGKMKDAQGNTSYYPLNKKRGGGKLGRRRKRGYIYDPKPMVPKAKTNLLPSKLKDEEYWQHRQRNNEAAKRSRENRRMKELETVNLIKGLTDNNNELKEKIKELESRNLYLEGLLRGLITDPCINSDGSGDD